MIKNTFLFLLIFFSILTINSHAEDIDTLCTTCGGDSYWKPTNTVNGVCSYYSNININYTKAPYTSCGGKYTKEYFLSNFVPFSEGSVYGTGDVCSKTIYYTCTVKPDCNSTGEVWDDSLKSCVQPPCPEGQHDDGTDVEVPNCVCDSGYPTIDPFTGDISQCVQPTCPSTDENGYSLKLENVSFQTCTEIYHPLLGYNVNYLSTDTVSCCYADVIDSNDTSNPNPCGDGNVLNSNNECVSLPDEQQREDCGFESYWSINEEKCLPIYPDEEDNETNDQSGTNDGLNGDGTVRDSNDSSSYNGGGTEDITDKTLLEFNNDEVNDMNSKYTNTITQKFNEFLKEISTDLLSLYKISIPALPNCGCQNPSYDFNLLGKSYSDTIEVCSPMTSILSTIKPVLWFFFLIGLLFTFFNGRNN